MSPEQLRSSRQAAARSDIWALGVITNGRPPFAAETITELTLLTAIDPPPPHIAANCPRGFDHLSYHCLEKDPAPRFQSVAELAMMALALTAGI